jgi:hypothetical protein
MYDPNAPRFTLKGVEIFAAGTHKGDSYSEADLDAMVSAHSALDFKPPFKAGHDKAVGVDGQPALGWIENLRREGSKLLADISDVPATVLGAIKAKAYDRVSAEVYHDLNRGGKTYPRALKALALLGADIPAVTGLKPLHEMQFGDGAKFKDHDVPHLGGTITVTLPSESAADFLRQFTTKEETMTKEQIDAAVAAAVKEANEKAASDRAALEKKYADEREADRKALAQMQAKERARDVQAKADLCRVPALRPALVAAYSLAFDAPAERKYSVEAGKEISATEVLDSLVSVVNANISKLFTVADGSKGKEVGRPDNTAESVGDVVDAKVKKYRQDHPKVGYAEALNIVLDADPELKLQYANA